MGAGVGEKVAGLYATGCERRLSGFADGQIHEESADFSRPAKAAAFLQCCSDTCRPSCCRAFRFSEACDCLLRSVRPCYCCQLSVCVCVCVCVECCRPGESYVVRYRSKLLCRRALVWARLVGHRQHTHLVGSYFNSHSYSLSLFSLVLSLLL